LNLAPQSSKSFGNTGKMAASTEISARDLEWYEVDASIIDEAARKLMIDYAGIAPNNVNEHVDAVRKKAFGIFPYPCIGMYRFLDLGILQSGVYEEIVERIKHGEKFLDLGCCFGQEIRQLLSDGVPASNCYGSDLRPEFIDLGYDLFQDRERAGITFLPGDVFDPKSDIARLNGSISIIYTGAFFHLFSRPEQLAIATRIVSLLKAESNVMVIGRQVGNTNPGNYTESGYEGEKERYRHSDKSWAELWDEVGEKTGTKWKTEAEIDEFGIGMGEMEKKLTERRKEGGARRLKFVVRRV